MKVNNSKSIRFAIAAALAVGTCQIASAVGLGPISVNSHIGEPLQASIKVNGLSPSDAANTRINIASAADYQRRGITKLPSHDGLRFGLTPSGNGYIITVRSNQQIREPFINFLLHMNSGGEEIVREYAVFLDPAAGNIIPPIVTETVVSEQPVASVEGKPLLNITPASSSSVGWQGNKPTVTQVNPVAAPPVARSAPAPEPIMPQVPQGTWNGRTYGPVQQGETLYSIANKVRPSEDYSINSVMRQIYNANPSAFSSRSLSSLMAGYTLRIPDFHQGATSTSSKPKRTTTSRPQPTRTKPKAVAPAPAQPPVSDDSTQQQQVTASDTATQETNVVVPPQADTPEVAMTEESVQPSLLNESNVDAEVEAVVVEEDQAAGNDVADTAAAPDTDHEVTNHDATVEAPAEEVVMTEEMPSIDEAVGNDDVMPEAPVAEDQVESIMPPVDEQPVLIEETDNGQGEEVAAVISEPVQAAVPSNSTPATPTPVAEEEDKGFLFTTYAILPTWQWLIICVVALALIALLLFRMRKKSVDTDMDADEGLDTNEMEAVLAKINAMDNDDDPVDNNAAVSAHHHDDLEDDWDVENFVNNTEEDELFDQEAEVEPMKHRRADVSLDKTEEHLVREELDEGVDFLFDDEEPAQNTSSKPHSSTQAVEEDFFADDEMVDWEELDTPASSPEKPVEPKPESVKPAVKPVAKPAAPQPTPAPAPEAKSNSAASDMDWLDDLVFDGEERPTRKAKPASAAPSSDEMEINLDLASSFIATGHGERAISWLEEVMELGNAEQKARAQALLDKIRGD